METINPKKLIAHKEFLVTLYITIEWHDEKQNNTTKVKNILLKDKQPFTK